MDSSNIYTMSSLSTLFILVLIPLTLSIAHSLRLYGNVYVRWLVQPLRSFFAGYSIGYIFLLLLPEVLGAHTLGEWDIALFPLLGFVVFHIAHRYVFRYTKGREKRLLLDEIHLATSAFYSFLISFTLVEILRSDVTGAVILVSVIALHTTLSELSHTHTVETGVGGKKMPVLIIATWLGGVLAISGAMPQVVTSMLFATTAGALIYITIREELPRGASGGTVWFVAGVLALVGVKSLM